MSDLIITARTLKSLVDLVLPLAGRDDMMPVLTAVQVCVDGEWLTATATDRSSWAKAHPGRLAEGLGEAPSCHRPAHHPAHHTSRSVATATGADPRHR